jgi:hypothetical protein
VGGLGILIDDFVVLIFKERPAEVFVNGSIDDKYRFRWSRSTKYKAAGRQAGYVRYCDSKFG